MDINTYRNYLLLGKAFWLLLEKFVPSPNHYGLLMERKAQL